MEEAGSKYELEIKNTEDKLKKKNNDFSSSLIIFCSLGNYF